MLLEEEPIKVTAFGADYLNKGIYDTTLTTLEFKNGVRGHIFVSCLLPYKEQKLIVVGSKGMAVFDDVSKEKLFIYPHKIEWKEGRIPVAHKAEYQVVPVDKKEPLKEELSHFIECVVQRKRPLTDGFEGLRVLRILELAAKSLMNNQSTIISQISPLTSYFVCSSRAAVSSRVGLSQPLSLEGIAETDIPLLEPALEPAHPLV